VLRSRPILIGSAVVAALLANYWVLEGALADRTNFDGSWISDLSTRSEGSGATFVALGTLAALALVVYGIVLVVNLGGRGTLLRRGAFAFLFAAVATVVAAVSPLSCAEGLEAACSLKEDPLDIVHSVATAGEIGGTILAFGLLGLGFLRGGRRRFGIASLAFGATLMTATFTLFPLLGRTPPPWRWPPYVLATSLVTHATYVATVALVDGQFDGSTRKGERPT